MNKDTYVYFLYSKTQYNLKKDIERKQSKTYIPGTVYVKKSGYVQYTEMCLRDNNSFSDSKVIAHGLLKDMKYTE